jgi:Sec-independent protein translocase protein TatA
MFNLGPSEIVVIAVVAILVFGARLPEVAAQAASVVMRMRRSLADLRRETGLDAEIAAARRSIEQGLPKGEARSLDLHQNVRRGVQQVREQLLDPLRTELEQPLTPPDPPTQPPPAPPAPDPGALRDPAAGADPTA